MAISKIAGQMLKDNLERDGANLAISDTVADTPVVFFDIANSRVGVNTVAPGAALDVVGNILAGNISATANISSATQISNVLVVVQTANIGGVNIVGNAISADSGILALGSAANISITGGTLNYILSTDGTGNLSWSSVANVGVIGNNIAMGTNT